LLGIEKHGGGGRKSDGKRGRILPVQELESEGISHDLGNVREWVENGVNYEVDKGEKPNCLQSAKGGGMLENEAVGSPSLSAKLVEPDKGVLFDVVGTEVEGSVVGNDCNGPAQLGFIGTTIVASEGGQDLDGGCEEEVGVVEPVWVRTRNGDILINGPIDMGSGMVLGQQPLDADDLDQGSNDSIESFGDDPTMMDGPVGLLTRAEQQLQNVNKGGKRKKKNHSKNFPNLPYNMLRKLPGALPNKKKGVNRKKGGTEEGSRGVEESVSGAALPLVCDNATTLSGPGDNVEFQLEVVLPGLTVDAEEIIPILEPISQTDVAMGPGNVLQSSATHVSREVHEAETLVNSGVELGINFQGKEGEDIAKVVAMEERDRIEKEGWESQRGDQ
jgi:hypothetical protein